MNKRVLILFLLQITVCSSVQGQTFQLANALQSNMVIQRGKPFTLWGTAKAKTTVLVQADWIKGPVTNFCNKEGLPALPFRTDQSNN